jgi:beta-N-acetylhexosaminidase
MKRISLILLALVIAGYSYGQQENRFYHWREDKACMAWVNKTYDSLSLEERIAQCYMLAAHIDSLPEMLKIEELVQDGRAGGIIFFKGHPTDQAYWTNRLQAEAKIPLMMQSGGWV